MAITKIQSESLNLADTYAFTGTVTGAGESNSPNFHAVNASGQALSDSTWTKITVLTSASFNVNPDDGQSVEIAFRPSSAPTFDLSKTA